MRFLFVALYLFFSLAVFGQAKPIFKIGKPDACAGEFKFFRNIVDCVELGPKSGKKYRDIDGSVKFFENPPVFIVGKSKDSDWPFAHPILNCAWNGWKPAPTFKIEFNKPKTKAEFVYLKIGFIDAGGGVSGVAVEVNGKEIAKQVDFFYAKDNPQQNILARTMIYNKGAKNKPSNPYVVKIKTADLKEGKNVIGLRGYVHKNTKTIAPQWVVYDFIELSEDSAYPKIPNYSATLLDRAVKAMGTEEVIFCVSGSTRGGHWYENIGNICSADDDSEVSKARSNVENFSRLGARLVKFNIKTHKYKILLEDKEGGIRDARLHYDARKILFAYRKGKSDKFKLYEIDIDGKNLRQLPTNSKGNDVEPCYLPNDDIMFVSDRKGRTVQCWMSPALNLHRYFAKEKIVRCMSGNPDVDNTPNVLRDGRVLYMRWDYNHRNQLKFHHLWSINPDGSNNTIYYGNSFPWGVFLNPRQVPNSEDIIFTAGYGHGQTNNAGAIAKLSPPFDPSDMYAMKFIRVDSQNYEPYPLQDNLIITSNGKDILILDHNGSVIRVPVPQELFASYGESYVNVFVGDKTRGRKCWMLLRNVQPVMKTQRENMRPDMADYSKKTASVFLQDVYIGRNMAGVKRGSIKKLLILQVLPTPVNFSGIYLPTGFGGSFALEGVLGTVPVYEDGSAFFEVPANIGIAFVALDENNNSVKRMMSSTNFAPATQTSCIGCHEHRTEAPIQKQKLPMAYRKGVSKIKKLEGVDLMIDYTRDIQPILNKYCVDCHNPKNPNGRGVILSMAVGERYITPRVVLQSADMCAVDWSASGDFKPYAFGSGGSRLARFAEGKHHNKKLSDKDMKILKAWLDIGAPHISTYASKDTGFPTAKRLRVFWDMKDTMKPANDVIGKRCYGCHSVQWRRWSYDGTSMLTIKLKNKKQKSLHTPRTGLINFIDPENSIAAIVPLAKSAGGWAEGIEKGSHPIVFKDKNDADYKILIDSARKTAERLEKERPFLTSKNFHPSYGYVKKMQELGLLPKDWNPKTPLDPYKIDEAYIRFQSEP